MPKCSVFGCKSHSSRTKGQDIHHFNFPKDPGLCNRWVKFCNKNVPNFGMKKTGSICSLHFEDSAFTNTYKIKKAMGLKVGNRDYLKQDAVPTLLSPAKKREQQQEKTSISINHEDLPQRQVQNSTAEATMNVSEGGMVKLKSPKQSISNVIKKRNILVEKVGETTEKRGEVIKKIKMTHLETKADETIKKPETICAVSSCQITAQDAKKRNIKVWFFRFPDAVDMRNQWRERCGPTANLSVDTPKICSLHFKMDDFDVFVQSGFIIRKLKKTAVPSLMLDYSLDMMQSEKFSTLAPVEEIYLPECPEGSDLDEQPVDQSLDNQPQKEATNCKVECSETLIQSNANTKDAQENIISGELDRKCTVGESTPIVAPPLTAYLINKNNQLQLVFAPTAQPLPNAQLGVGTSTSQVVQENCSLTMANIRVICRVCLRNFGDLNLSETKYGDLSYFEVLEAVTGLIVKRENPLLICKICAQDMIRSYMFKKRSERSELALLKFKDENDQSNNEMDFEVSDKEHDYAISKLEALNSTSLTNDPFIYQQNPTPMLYFVSGAMATNQTIQENSPENCNKQAETDTVNNTNLREGQTTTTNKKKTRPSLQSRRKATIKSGYARQAYKLISKGHIDEAKKLLSDKGMKIPPRLQAAMSPSNCKICGVRLANEYEYKQHANITKHYRKTYPCDHCDKTFHSSVLLYNHKLEVTGSKLCETCGSSYATYKGLLQHIKASHKTDKYKCGACGISFTGRKLLAQHRWDAHGFNKSIRSTKKNEICELCGRALASKLTLRQHINTVHLRILPHACDLCDSKFSTATTLRKHREVHTSDTEYECGFCNVVMRTYQRFLDHRLTWHCLLPVDADVSTEFINSECTHCEAVCPNKQSLSIHLKQHEIDICAYCDHTFTNEEELTDHHDKEHEGTLPWTCRYCNKTFNGGKSLFLHLALHKSKAYKCGECHKMYDSAHKLKRHKLSSHDVVKRHECRFCAKRFTNRSTVVVHERLHTGEKPFKCDICEMRFVSSGNAKKHRRVHFGKTRLIQQ